MTGNDTTGPPGVPHPGERSSGAVNGIASPSQNGLEGNVCDEPGRRMWKGDLYVQGHRNAINVPCVALPYTLAQKTPLRDASGWPATLQCDSSKLKYSVQVLNKLRGPFAQWYVRFAPVDDTGDEKDETKLLPLLEVMVERKLAFEISCHEAGGTPGTLCLWGAYMPDHGHYLLGGFLPAASEMALELNDHERRIWKGDLHVQGHRNAINVSCVAMQYTLAQKTPLRDASGWPATLRCDSSKLKNSVQVMNELSGSIAQWYVLFTPIDENGIEVEVANLSQLVKVMVEKKLAFEISCNEGGGTPGTLCLWGAYMPDHGHSLFGVFRPDISVEREL